MGGLADRVLRKLSCALNPRKKPQRNVASCRISSRSHGYPAISRDDYFVRLPDVEDVIEDLIKRRTPQGIRRIVPGEQDFSQWIARMKPLVYLLNRLIDQTHRALTSWMCYERHHCIFVLYQLHPEPCADHWCFDLIPVRSADTLGDSCCFEDEVIAVRSGHPLTCGKLTKERLNEFPQLVVTPGDSEQNDSDASAKIEGASHRVSLDRALGEFQKEKINFGGRTAVSVSTFTAVTPFLQLSNMLAILPRRLAMWVAANAPLSLLEPPSPSVAVDIEMLWDQSADEDRGLKWLMKQLAESVGDFG